MLCIAIEEIAKAWASRALMLAVHHLGSLPIRLAGSDAARDRDFSPRLASDGSLAALALSEPDAGSDPLTMRMRARRERGEWVLNGAENWIANAGVADLYVVFAESRRATDRIAVFAVPGDAPGLTISRLEHKMGMRGSPSGDVRLPDEYVVSAPRRGIHDRHAHARSLAPRDRRPSARHRAGGDRLRGVPRPGKDHEIQRVVIARALWSLTAVRRAGRD